MESSPKRRKIEVGTDIMTEETGIETETISSDGDVILVVGRQETRFRVSSVQLAMTSTTFKALFFGGFAESLPSTSTTREVPLPDDDPRMMRTLLNIAHHRNNYVKNSIDNVDFILDLAKLVDKYDMTTAVKFSSFTWLQMCEDTSLYGIVTLTLSAYLFKNHRKFYDLTGLLTRDYDWTIDTFYEELDMEALPLNMLFRLIMAMEEKRNRVLKKIETEMVRFSELICNIHCESKGVVLARIKSCLESRNDKNNILGLKTETSKVMIEKLRSFDAKGGLVTIPCSGSHTHLSPSEAQLAFRSIIDHIDSYSKAGIVLACILDGACGMCEEHDFDG